MWKVDVEESLGGEVTRESSDRGRLTVFFGASPGLGKTYMMLEAARLEVQERERDVCIGIVDAVGFERRGSFAGGFEVLPRQVLEHDGVRREELDLDACLARHPELVLIGELAHTNAPGSRRSKRWQDVEALLDAGIDVFSTLDVRNLESSDDVVAQIAGVIVRETVPDAVFDEAWEVFFVDGVGDSWLERVPTAGALTAHAARQSVRTADMPAAGREFSSLRELALRRTADRIRTKRQRGGARRADSRSHARSATPGTQTRRRRTAFRHARRDDTIRRAAVRYVAGLMVVTAASLAAWFVFGRSELADVVMVLLLGVVVVSMRLGYGPSILAAVGSVLCFEYFFIPPYFSFAIANLRHVVTFAVMFVVAFVVSHQTKRIRDQATAARHREERTANLYAVSRELGRVHSREALLKVAARHARNEFRSRLALLLPSVAGELEAWRCDPETAADCESDRRGVDWAWLHQRPAGIGSPVLASLNALFLPVIGSRGRVGVIALFPADPSVLRYSDGGQFLDAFSGLIGSALERIDLAEQARRARMRVETEQLRNALLSSVSHDLRTPLAVVTGATSALLDANAPKDELTRRLLLQTAHQEALGLNRLVGNLLDMTRLEAGAMKLQKEVQPFEEVVGSALNRVEDRLSGREVTILVPSDLPWIPFDSVLIQQVLINLLENATKYTPPKSPLQVSASVIGRELLAEISDRGSGVIDEDAERIFDKFYRGREREGGGVGLGLTISRGIVNAHGGRIWVEPRPGGGASFRFTLPLQSGATSSPMVRTALADAREGQS